MRAIIFDIDYSEKACEDLTNSLMFINPPGKSTYLFQAFTIKTPAKPKSRPITRAKFFIQKPPKAYKNDMNLLTFLDLTYNPGKSFKFYSFQGQNFKIFLISTNKQGPRGGGGHTSISLTGMLVREQISTTQKSRMTLNSNPQKIECPKFKPKKIELLKTQCLSKFE